MSDSHKYVIDLLVRVLLAVALAVSGWALISAVEHETRLDVIESNRFTATDALQLRRDVESDFRGAVDEIKKCLNQIQRDQLCE